MDQSVDFYKVIPKEYLKPVATYANFPDIRIPLPIRVNVVGSSGGGKTQAVMNLINFFNCFDKFYLFVGDSEESLYSYLIDFVRDKYGEDSIFISNDLAEVPHISEFDSSCNNLVIIDDLINSKSNKDINALNLFTNGRKQNVSVIYVSQDYFLINKTVRKNCGTIVLTRFDDEADLMLILRKIKQSLTMEQIQNIYQYCISGGKHNFMTIVTDAPRGERYRRNLKPVA